jgi:hypothetical protein
LFVAAARRGAATLPAVERPGLSTLHQRPQPLGAVLIAGPPRPNRANAARCCHPGSTPSGTRAGSPALASARSISALQGEACNSPLLRPATTASGVLVLPPAF